MVVATVAALCSGVQAQSGSALKSAVKNVISKVKGNNISSSELADYLGYLLLKLDVIQKKAGMPVDVQKKDLRGKGLQELMDYIFTQLEEIEKNQP